MAYSNGVITAPVSIYDVMQAVPVTLSAIVGGTTVYASSNDVGVLCGGQVGDTITGTYTDPTTGTVTTNVTWTIVSRVNINIWSIYKPVDNTALHYMGQWDSTNNTWKSPSASGFTPSTPWWMGKGASWKYGLTPFYVSGSPSAKLPQLISKYNEADDDLNGWTYNRPTGGLTSPYRLTDFAGYNHRAQALAENFMVSNPLVISTNQEATLTATMMYSAADGSNITPEIILGSSTWYFGVVLTNYNTETIVARVTGSVNETFLQKSLRGVLVENKTYKAYPFFSLNAEGDTESNNTYYTIPLLNPVTTVARNRSSLLDVTISAEYGSSGTNKSVVVITITTASNASYANCYLELDRLGESVDYEIVALTSSGTSYTGRLNNSSKSVQTQGYFNLNAGTTYTITISNLDTNASYMGTFYATADNLTRRFNIMEVIQ